MSTTIRIEAESLNLMGYRTESSTLASGGRLISFRDGALGETGIASGTLNFSGNFDIYLGYYDENDGQASVDVSIGDSAIASVVFDQNLESAGISSTNFVYRKIASNISISNGQLLSLWGQENAAEHARVDYIEFVPIGAEIPTPTPTPIPAAIRIEAEAMTRTGYQLETLSSASGSKIVGLTGSTGKLATSFNGASGTYEITVAYHDEIDGVSQMSVVIDGVVVDSWSLDQNLGSDRAIATNLVQRVIPTGVAIHPGSTIEIKATKSGGEHARVDYIELKPTGSSAPTPSPTPTPTPITINGTNAAETLQGDSQNNIIQGLAGNDVINGAGGNDTLIGGTGNDTLNGGSGNDTASYTQALNGIRANLTTGIANRVARIMPLGDSITYGVVASSQISNQNGGYRTVLWDKFQKNDMTIDFVGSSSNGPSGPDSLGDKDHQGERGKTIDWIDARINGFLGNHQPDIVLLMIGTNDTSGDSVSNMVSELSRLIDKITAFSPDLDLFVSTIPPARIASRNAKAEEYNSQMSGLITAKQAQGKQVSFVNMTGGANGLTMSDISPLSIDNGLHPTLDGYQKIGNFWYNAMSSLGIEQGTYKVDRDTLESIEDLIGSAFDDRLIGDAGVNVIEGGKGSDRLTGNGGADIFVYRQVNHGGDTITDFDADDILHISASGFGGGLVAGIALNTSIETGGLISDSNPTALGSKGNFLYNTSSGVLSYDNNGAGSGGVTEIATLTGAPSLDVKQIVIVA
jgi:Ca2+-binding RTX toxin-like protein